MKAGVGRGSAKGAGGVLDAGVVLTRLDPSRRGHRRAKALLDPGASRRTSLWISAVNLSEVLQHGRGYSRDTGVDLVALLSSFSVAVHAPDAEVARRVAALAAWGEISLADRFAAATAEHLRARLYTTDGVLASAAKRHGWACTLL
jgi:predicted nucleic acid-binding protein